MPEPNGSGRLDRIEAILQRVAENQLAMQEHHDSEFKQLMTWQVLTQDRLDRMERKFESLTERIDNLVSAIGELIQRLPPPSSARS